MRVDTEKAKATNECDEHIYDTDGFCEWSRQVEKKWVAVKQIFSKCSKCNNGKASNPK